MGARRGGRVDAGAVRVCRFSAWSAEEPACSPRIAGDQSGACLSLKQLLRPLVPPIILDAVRGTRVGPLSFAGDYSSWNEASAAAGGYDAGDILERVAAATRQVVSGKAIYER